MVGIFVPAPDYSMAGTYENKMDDNDNDSTIYEYITLFDDGTGCVSRGPSESDQNIYQDVEWEYNKDENVLELKMGRRECFDQIEKEKMYISPNRQTISSDKQFQVLAYQLTNKKVVSKEKYQNQIEWAELCSDNDSQVKMVVACDNVVESKLLSPDSYKRINYSVRYDKEEDCYYVFIDYEGQNAFGVYIPGKAKIKARWNSKEDIEEFRPTVLSISMN